MAIELIYTSWDIKLFIDDIWREADEELRHAIKAQWEENKRATGGHAWDPPEWAEIVEGGIPLPPFKWDEERRARLRAELDAIFAKLYGLNRKQLRYILDPADLTEKELENILDDYEEVEDPLDEESYRARCEASTFPGETFRVLEEKELVDNPALPITSYNYSPLRSFLRQEEGRVHSIGLVKTEGR